MLVYEKKVDEERKIFAAEGNVPTEDDIELTYKNDSDEEITPELHDVYLDNGHGGIKRASDGEMISVFMGDVCIVDSKLPKEETDEPGEGEPEVPGEDDPEVPGEDDPEEPGEDEPEEPGEDDPEEPGEDEPEEQLGPAVMITDIAEKEFVAGADEFVEFTFSTIANDDAGVMVIGTSDFGTMYEDKIAALEYKYEDGDAVAWINMKGQNFGSAAGFPLSDATSTFRVKFTEDAAGEYAFTAAMKKASDNSVVCSVDVPFTVA